MLYSQANRERQKSSQCPVKVEYKDSSAWTVWEGINKEVMTLKNPEWERLRRQVRGHWSKEGMQASEAA